MTSPDHQDTADDRDIPRLRRSITFVKWMTIGLFIYASVYVLGHAKSFLVPIVLAFLLSMVFGPVRRFFDRRGVPSGLTSLAIVLVLLFVLFGILTALAMPATNWVEHAPQIQDQIENKLSAVSESLNGLFTANKRLDDLMQSGSKNVQMVQVQGAGIATSAALTAPSMLAQILFTLVLLLFLLASGDMFYEKLVHVMPTLRDKKRAVLIAHNIERKLSSYLLTITLINACLGIAVGTAMWILDMPSPLVFGVIAFLFNFVPYIGALAGIAIAAVVAVVSYQWIGWALIVGGVYLALTAVEGQLITPYFVGRRLRLNTVMVFVAVSFWAWLWSAVGMILAVPLLVAVKTFCEHIDGLAGLGDFLSERHAESTDKEVEVDGHPRNMD